MKHLSEEEIIEYVETGKLDEQLARHIPECEQCQCLVAEYQEVVTLMSQSKDVTPPAEIAQELAIAIAQASTPKSDRRYWQVAAAVAILMVGYALGKLSIDDQSAEVLALQSQVDVLKEVAMTNALHQSSASERLQVVNRIDAAEPALSKNLVKTLLRTLNTDESPNVRYAAAQSLARFASDSVVRKELALSLELQNDALIQISLISILVEAQEKHAIRPLKQMLKEKDITPEVKRQAQIALDILS